MAELAIHAGGTSTTAELVAAVSLAGDMGVGLPLEHCLRACYIGLHVAAELGLDTNAREDVFWTLLLKDAGCTSFTTQAAAFLGGDEIAARRQLLFYGDAGSFREQLDWALTNLSAQSTPWKRAGRLVDFMANGRDFFREGFQSSAEVAQRIATRLGMRPSVCQALGACFERWDGKGMPRGLRGEMIPIVARVAYASTYFEIFDRLGGPSAAREVGRARRESAFDGAVVDAFQRVAGMPGFWTPLEGESVLATVLALKPGLASPIADAPALEVLALTCADFVDMKSPYLVGHSRRVTELASAIGRRLRLATSELEVLNRAALMHDLGYVAVPSFVVNKLAEERSAQEQATIHLHPQHAETMLRPVAALTRERELVRAHHERREGPGNPAQAWDEVPLGARIIAVADRFDELTHDQPGVLALTAEEALRQLRQESGEELDPELVLVLCEHWEGSARSQAARQELPANLTEREVEVLRLLARGMSRREVAKELVISDATARHHLEHIYDKIGVTTRVGAVLFALEHGLLNQ